MLDSEGDSVKESPDFNTADVTKLKPESAKTKEDKELLQKIAVGLMKQLKVSTKKNADRFEKLVDEHVTY